MIKLFFKIALRNARRHPLYVLVNLLGLSLAFAATILIYLHIRDEQTFDRFQPQAPQCYRLLTYVHLDKEDKVLGFSKNSYLAADLLQKEFAEIENALRIFGGNPKKLINYGDKKRYVDQIFYTEPAFFDFFKVKVLMGKPQKALSEPNSIVLTRRLALDLFASLRAAMGQEIKLLDDEVVKVKAILEDPPSNSHLKFNGLVSMHNVREEMEPFDGSKNDFYTYLHIQNKTDFAGLEQKIADFYETWIAGNNTSIEARFRLSLQELTQIHLSEQDLEGDELLDIEDRGYIDIFKWIALFIIFVAAINYMNLATARSSLRLLEIGVRKVLGATRGQIIRQFLGESFLLCFVSMLLALYLVYRALPYLNEVADKQLDFFLLLNLGDLSLLLLVIIFMGLLAGLYPAVYLSGFRIQEVLKGKLLSGQLLNTRLRKALVIFQFTVSISIIIITWRLYDQLDYVKEKNLGFNKDYLLALDIFNMATFLNLENMKRELREHPGVSKVASSSSIPGIEIPIPYLYRTKINDQDQDLVLNTMRVDPDFIDLMELEVLISEKGPEEAIGERVLINEHLARRLLTPTAKPDDYPSLIGKKIQSLIDDSGNAGFEASIGGVVKDFHYQSLHDSIQPVILLVNQMGGAKLLLKTDPKLEKEALRHIEKVWYKFDKKYPFEPYFLDRDFARQYLADERKAKIFLAFSFLTTIIACLGLFGLAAFTAEQKSKEISIRKVLGASIQDILFLMSREFLSLIVVSLLLSYLITSLSLDWWMQEFAYRSPLSLKIYALVSFLTLGITSLTILGQALRAAYIDPLTTLRNE